MPEGGSRAVGQPLEMPQSWDQVKLLSRPVKKGRPGGVLNFFFSY